MTADRIAARNRANAAKSTGPRTTKGKAVVSRNARRHGATARPERSCVAAWLSIILDKSELQFEDVQPGDDRHYAALALAEAEARMAAAEEALDAFERNPAPPADIVQAVWADPELKTIDPPEYVTTRLQHLRWRQRTVRTANLMAEQTQQGGRRHRLLRRYLAEARARHRKAFAAWIAVLRRGVDQRLDALRGHFPEQSQPSGADRHEGAA